MAQAQGYPPALSERSGGKVGWKTYATQADATAAAKVATRDAARQARLGYDFGYCSPGSITRLNNGTFEVCVP